MIKSPAKKKKTSNYLNFKEKNEPGLDDKIEILSEEIWEIEYDYYPSTEEMIPDSNSPCTAYIDSTDESYDDHDKKYQDKDELKEEDHQLQKIPTPDVCLQDPPVGIVKLLTKEQFQNVSKKTSIELLCVYPKFLMYIHYFS